MTRRKSKAERYEEVLAAAAKVFAEQGYRAATIHRVAAELEMTGAALYHYVRSKEDLLVEISMRAGRRVLEAAEEVAARDISPAEKLRALFHRHLEVTLADRSIFTILIQERSEIPADRVDELVEGERQYFETVHSVLREFAPDETGGQDARLGALAFFGMLNWALRWYREDGAYTLDDVADRFFRIFAAGFLSGPTRNEALTLVAGDAVPG
jgi:AcrR family transcriptional regulator